MRNELTFVGLDLATTAGVAFLSEDLSSCRVYEIKGNPFEQFYQIQQMISDDPAVWGIEELHIFRNAKTVRSLAERSGFIKWMLKGVLKEKVMMVQVSRARKFIGAKSKEDARDMMQLLVKGNDQITDNHSDAVLVAMMVAKEVLKLEEVPGPVIQVGDMQ